MSTTEIAKIHPIVIYPFHQPRDITDLERLYSILIKELDEEKGKYFRPITVIPEQTYLRNTTWLTDKESVFKTFLNNNIEKYSDVLRTWSVDTCQSWLAGLGDAYNRSSNAGSDVYWLIPGDFNYTQKPDVLTSMRQLPESIKEGCNLCLGEISVELNSSKQLIDTYGTYGLLYNWFPAEAQGIRQITDKPRTEFFAISHDYLQYVLKKRWYAYEQMIVILLHGMSGKDDTRGIQKLSLGNISDLPEGRDTLASALAQVERTERVLKVYWREHQEQLASSNWSDQFKILDAQSEKIRSAAMVILAQTLRPFR
jgi:hypothetical protein